MDKQINLDILSLADHPNAYAKTFKVTSDDIDGFGHVNNSVYLKWIDTTVWEHTRSVGLDENACRELNRGMVVKRHNLEYLLPALLDEELVLFTWLTQNDGKLRVNRVFQLMRLHDKQTLLRANTHYICVNLETGKPTRMPAVFVSHYADTLPD